MKCSNGIHEPIHMITWEIVLFSKKITERDGDSEEKINYELTKSKAVLEWMVKNKIRDHREVTTDIMDYYADPERFYEHKRLEVELWI